MTEHSPPDADATTQNTDTSSDWSDWTAHALRLDARGELGRGPMGLLIVLPALAQPWTCASGLCTPGRREAKARSCCADLDVVLDDDELSRIEAAMPDLAPRLAAVDPRWAAGALVWREGDTLTRPGRRCAFSRIAPEGLRCVLHEIEAQDGLTPGALKPAPCRMFPLIWVDADDGRALLSAVHPRTARLVGTRPAAAFPCIGEGTLSLAESMKGALVELLGARGAAAVVKQVREFRR